MYGQRQSGFTIAEIMCVMLMLGTICLLMLPKVLFPQEDRKAAALIRESYTIVGELYNAYKSDPVISGEIAGLDDSDNGFIDFMRSHLNILASSDYSDLHTPPSGCRQPPNFLLPSGVLISSICKMEDDNLEVKIIVPLKPTADLYKLTEGRYSTEDLDRNEMLVYTMILVKDTDRYTTKYSLTGNTEDCTLADTVLHIIEQCPR